MAGFRDAQGEHVLDDADVVVRGRFENQRIAVVPMEGNAIAVVPGEDGSGHDLTIYASTQMPHMLQAILCRIFGRDPSTMRVVTTRRGRKNVTGCGLARRSTWPTTPTSAAR